MRQPTRHPGGREGGAEQLPRQTDRIQQNGGIELDVDGQASLGVAPGERGLGGLLQRAREGQAIVLQGGALPQSLERGFKDPGAPA